MADRIETPIKACHECWANYTLTEWDNLEKLEQDEGKPERRACRCGVALELDRDGLDQLDLTDDAKEYARHHPTTARVPVSVEAAIDPGPPPPEKKAKKKTKKKAKSKPTPKVEVAEPANTASPPPALMQRIVTASIRNVAPQVRFAVVQWLRRVPPEADAFTLGDLRDMVTRGQL